LIDVGLVGFGLAGRGFHAPVIQAVEGWRLAVVVQRTGDEREKFIRNVRMCGAWKSWLASKRFSCVIATPNQTIFR